MIGLDLVHTETTVNAADIARFRQWMHKNLSHAADHFGLTVTGPARLGWLDRSISAPVEASDRRLWLRVVSEDKQWTGGEFWTGNLDANVFSTLPKPQVLDVYEWEEWRQQRAAWPPRCTLPIMVRSHCASKDSASRNPGLLPLLHCQPVIATEASRSRGVGTDVTPAASFVAVCCLPAVRYRLSWMPSA